MPGIGVAGAVRAKVAPSTRRSVPAVPSIAYAVEPCCTTSRVWPAGAACVCAATSADAPSSRVSCPAWDEASHAEPGSSRTSCTG